MFGLATLHRQKARTGSTPAASPRDWWRYGIYCLITQRANREASQAKQCGERNSERTETVKLTGAGLCYTDQLITEALEVANASALAIEFPSPRILVKGLNTEAALNEIGRQFHGLA